MQHLRTVLNYCTCTVSVGTPSVGNESFKHEWECLLLTVNNCLLGDISWLLLKAAVQGSMKLI